ncbi:Trafficking protein particle complex 8 [Clonorchis sinensis]|uniref:Trafficking protein particle complex 8 n=1 Tax=Clonorchis sinensis TaxID=79923 RepID=A0A8T1MZU1_CLOSI|nr:Trafficking protein particle complex 8 [Clonorchis sinensis]
MAKCTFSGGSFVNFVISPCASLIVSSDAEEACSELNLRFSELLRPFSQLTKDVTLRDNNNLLHTVSNLRVNFIDTASPPAPPNIARSHLKEIVNACSSDSSMQSTSFTNGRLSLCVPATTPWFEAWRYVFIKSLQPSTHEFLGHCLACIFVVSTRNVDPVGTFSLLTQQQQQQQKQQGDSAYPRWFNNCIAKFYLLLHDASTTPQASADECFSQMERTFGAANCYLLTLFIGGSKIDCDVPAKPLSNGAVISDGGTPTTMPLADTQTDPWMSHLLPHGYRIPAVAEPICMNPPNSVLRNSADDWDPLSGANDSSCLGPGQVDRFGGDSWSRENDRKSFVSPRYYQPHGQNLSQIDLERIRSFVYDFVVRCLVPWVEQTMRGLNEQIAHRMRLSRSFLSATKKFFSGAVSGNSTTSSSTANSVASQLNSAGLSQSTHFITSTSTPSLIGMIGSGGNLPPMSSDTVMARNSTIVTSREDIRTPPPPPMVVVYTPDAPEMQMRRLADLAFLFQQYEMAHQTYNVLKRDFQNDSAWLYYAGAQEMSALAIYMQGTTSQRQYPFHYVDSAVTIYLQSCQAAELALRATLLNAEALCSRGLYAECAMSLFRLTSEDDDLTSGLLIEQAAHCVLHLRRPLLRKFAFRMALAAHRYNRAKQAHLAIRSYRLAAPLLTGRCWSLAEDHINYNIGKQAYLIGDLATSAASLRQSLVRNSKQSVERQALFVREYLVVLKKHLSIATTNRNMPEFPLPIVRLKDVKTMVGKPTRLSKELPIEARGVQFTDDDEDFISHSSLSNEDLNEVASRVGFKFPWWMEGTDVSDSESDSDQDAKTEQREEPEHLFNPFDRPPVECQPVRDSIVLTNSRVARRLEMLLQRSTVMATSKNTSERESHAAARKLSTISNPFTMLHTRRSVRHQKPLVPAGESITCQIPLTNPMQITLVFSSLHLLWSFHPKVNCPDSANIRPVSNETLPDESATHRSRQCMSTEIVSEFIMLPEESKTLEVGLLTKETGQLQITGLSFDWTYSHGQKQSQDKPIVTFTAGDPSEDRPIDGRSVANGIDASVTQRASSGQSFERTCVRGKVLLLEPSKGTIAAHVDPKSQSSPLTWDVIDPAPLLKVSFSDLPEKLLQGQLFHLDLSLANISSQPLTTLRLASNWPGLVTCGSSEHTTLEKDPDQPPDSANSPISCVHPVVNPWLDVSFRETGADSEHQSMPPRSSYSLPMWIRAPHITNPHRRHHKRRRHAPATSHQITSAVNYSTIVQTRTVHLVFHYASMNPNPAHHGINSRFVRHFFEIEVQPSLRFEALVTPSSVSDVRNLLLSLNVENMTTKTTRTTFEVAQVCCASRHWTISPVMSCHSEPPCVKPADTIRLFFKLTPHALENPSCSTSDNYSGPERTSSSPRSPTTLLSTVDFVSTAESHSIRATKSPCIDFFFRSGTNWNCPVRLSKWASREHGPSCASKKERIDVALIVIWRVKQPSANSCDTSVYGQSHIAVTRLGVPSVIPSDRQSSTCKPKSGVSHTLSSSSQSFPSSALHLSRLVRLRLQHPPRVAHQFPTKPFTTADVPIAYRSPIALNLNPVGRSPGTSSPSGKRLADIPVVAELCNCSTLPVSISLEPWDGDRRCDERGQLSEVSEEGEFQLPSFLRRHMDISSIPCVQWSGLTLQRLTLSSGESRSLHLQARVPHPGIYYLGNLSLKAAQRSDKSEEPAEFIPQNTVFPSFVIVDSASTFTSPNERA